MDWMFSMDSVFPEPVSPPPPPAPDDDVMWPLFRRFPIRGERGRRGERPGLPDAEPLPFGPTSSFDTDLELPYMTAPDENRRETPTGTKRVSPSPSPAPSVQDLNRTRQFYMF